MIVLEARQSCSGDSGPIHRIGRARPVSDRFGVSPLEAIAAIVLFVVVLGALNFIEFGRLD